MNAQGVTVEHAYGRPILSSLHAAFSAGALLGAALGALAAGLGIDASAHLALVAAAIAIASIATGGALLPADADRGAAGQPLVLRLPRQLAALGAIAFLSLFCEGAASDWSAVYLAGPLGAGADVAAAAFAGFAAAMMLGRVGGDRLVARLGEVTVVRAGAALPAGGIALGLLLGTPVAGIIAFTCLGAGVAGIVPIVFRAAGTHPEVPAGIGLAAVSSAGYTGFLVGPPVIGSVASVTGLPRALGLIVLAALTMSALAGHTRVTRVTRSSTGPTG
jgi:hypothetical protein